MTAKPCNCKRCEAAPEVENVGGYLHIHCPNCGLMFLHGYGDMTEGRTIEAWDSMNAEYGVSWSY